MDEHDPAAVITIVMSYHIISRAAFQDLNKSISRKTQLKTPHWKQTRLEYIKLITKYHQSYQWRIAQGISNI